MLMLADKKSEATSLTKILNKVEKKERASNSLL